MDKSTRFLVELSRAEAAITAEKERLRERYQAAQRKSNIAWNLNMDTGAKVGTAVGEVLAQWAWQQQGIRLIHALRTCRKLRTVAAAGILTDNDEELRSIRSLAASIK